MSAEITGHGEAFVVPAPRPAVRRWLGLMLALLATAGSAKAAELAPHYGRIPDWVAPAPPPTIQAAQPGAPVQFLLLDNQLSFSPAGDQYFTEMKTKVLTPEGLAMGNPVASWSPDTESLTVNRLTITRDGKVIDVLAKDKFAVLRREQNLELSALDGVLTATLQVKGLQVGDVLDFAVTKSRREPVLGGRSNIGMTLPLVATQGRARLRAIWSAGTPVRWQVTTDMAPPKIATAAGVTELRYDFDGLPSAVGTDSAPLRFNLRRGVEFSSFHDWSDVSAAMAPLFVKAATLSPDSPLKAEAAKIRAAASDPLARAMLALRLVQDQIRYVYVGLNDGAYTPADADTTWSRRFGDCKAKTALLLALLKELGVEAEPSLISSARGDGLNERLPRLDIFDHVLVRARIAGETYWLDGTRIGDRDPEDLKSLPYHWTLPVGPAGGKLVALTEPPAYLPQSETVMTIDASGGMKAPTPVTAEAIYRGDLARGSQRLLASLTPTDAERRLKKKWADDIEWVEPAKVSWTYDEARGLLRLSMQGVGKAEWSAAERNGSPTAHYFELDNSAFDSLSPLKRPAEQDQQAPYATAFPSYLRWTTIMRLPQDARATGVQGAAVSRKLGGYAFKRRTEKEDGVAVAYRSTRTLTPEIPAADAVLADASRKEITTVPVYAWVDDQPQDAALSGLKQAAAKGQPDQLLQLAQDQYAIRDYAGALKTLDAALAKKPAMAPALAMKGQLLWAQNQYADAAKAYAAAIKAGRLDEPTLLAEAWMLGEAGQLGPSIDHFTAALVKNPKSSPLLRARAQIYLRVDDIQRAQADADAAVASTPEEPIAYRVRGAVLARGKRYDEALASMNKAVRLDPDAPGAFFDRAVALMKLGRDEDAVADLEEAMRMDPLDAAFLTRFTQAQLKLGQVTVALQRIDAALALRPHSEAMLNESCWSRAGANRELDRAAADCDAALKLYPTSANLFDSRAFVSLRQGDFKRAIGFYDKALSLRPKNASSLYGRGLAKLRAGDVTGDQDLASARALDARAEADYVEWGVTPSPKDQSPQDQSPKDQRT
jgi:tetratricopeptide (TPR) repeat protein